MTTVLKTKLEKTVNKPAIPVGREKKLKLKYIQCVWGIFMANLDDI